MKNDAIDIRWAEKSDKGAIDKITGEYSKADHEHGSVFFDEAIKGKRLLVAYSKNRPAGYLVYQVLWGNTPFLSLLRIMPKFQGQGLARQMLSILEEKLKSEGFEILLSSSEAGNESSHTFHEKMNFQSAGSLQISYEQEDFFIKHFK